MPLTKINPVYPDTEWQWIWAAYDEASYAAVLDFIHPDDIVLEIGAGDLRLARQIARVAQKVVAVEIHPELLTSLVNNSTPLPENLTAICADALEYKFPKNTSLAVMLIRHFQHTQELMEKLRTAGCRWLVTNSRWRMGIEKIDLFAPRLNYHEIGLGWYACWCGRVGFKPGPAQAVDENVMENIYEVIGCPGCGYESY